MAKHYAGVGSRQTPKPWLDYMTEAAKTLEEMGYVLQSGGATGADQAFINGVSDPANIRSVFPGDTDPSKNYLITKRGFSGKGRVGYESTEDGRNSVEEFHPNAGALNDAAKALMERNFYQVMGNPSADMEKVDFVVCWAPVEPDGNTNRDSGGTGQAIRIARANGIPVYNLYLPEMRKRLEDEILGKSLDVRIPEPADPSLTAPYRGTDITDGMIRTGYYAKAADYINPVSVSRTVPERLDGIVSEIPELAPSEEIFRRYQKDRDENAYAEAYGRQLDSVDWDKVCKKVSDMFGNNGPVTLMCYEKEGEFCHRHVAASRLEREMRSRNLLNDEVEELGRQKESELMLRKLSDRYISAAWENYDKLMSVSVFTPERVTNLMVRTYYTLESYMHAWGEFGRTGRQGRLSDMEAYLRTLTAKDEGPVGKGVAELLNPTPDRTKEPDKDEIASFVRRIADLRTEIAKGTDLERRPRKLSQYEKYNQMAFLKMVFGPRYEAMLRLYPEEYDKIDPGISYEFRSGTKPENEDADLTKLLEQYGYISGFPYGLSIDYFDHSMRKEGKDYRNVLDPSDVFAGRHNYAGIAEKDCQGFADEANLTIYRMFLADALDRLMLKQNTKGMSAAQLRETKERLLPVAAKMLENTYTSWMAPYTGRLGIDRFTLSLDPAMNARLYKLATGMELPKEREEEKPKKKVDFNMLKPGDPVTLPSGQPATVKEVNSSGMLVVETSGGKLATFSPMADITPGVVAKSEKRRVPAGVPCLAESLEASRNKLKGIREEISRVTDEVSAARELGDLSENSEYQYGKERLRELRKRESDLSKQINTAAVMNTSDRFGKQFTFTDLETGKRESVTVLGPWEADGKNVINCQSPLGTALWDMEKGEEKTFDIMGTGRSIRLEEIGPSPLLENLKASIGKEKDIGVIKTPDKAKPEGIILPEGMNVARMPGDIVKETQGLSLAEP